MGLAQFDEKQPNVQACIFLDTDTTSPKTIGGPWIAFARIDAIRITSTSLQDHTLALHMYDLTNDYPIGEVVVPAGAGSGAVPPVDVASPPLVEALGGIVVSVAMFLRGHLKVALDTGEAITVVAFGGEL